MKLPSPVSYLWCSGRFSSRRYARDINEYRLSNNINRNEV